MNIPQIAGCFTALITPFTDSGIDKAALESLIEEQLEAGIHGLVPCGSTGEAATMTEDERISVIDTTIKKVAGRVPVIAGTGSNCTAESIRFSKMARDKGADAVMLVVPYYNKPTQDGIFKHFETIAKEVNVPVVVYNVPGRTASSIHPKTVRKLCEVENIVAIKEASGKVENTIDILSDCPDMIVLSGDDCLFLPLLSIGATGLISVASNVIPKPIATIYNAFADGQYNQARKLFYDAWPIFKAMFYETNPIPVKAALGLMGKIDPRTRLPLTPMNREHLEELKNTLAAAGVI